jgi:adenine phosphoribosyltransferase
MDGEALKAWIRDVPDFPKAGILYRDLTPLLQDPKALAAAVEGIAAPLRDLGIERVLGIESRGFLFGAPVAMALGAGLGLVRKEGKLPSERLRQSYDLEYGTDAVEMHVDAVEKGQRVVVLDDLIATGGTASAAVALAREAGAEVVCCSFLVELGFLEGRERIDVPCRTVIRY